MNFNICKKCGIDLTCSVCKGFGNTLSTKSGLPQITEKHCCGIFQDSLFCSQCGKVILIPSLIDPLAVFVKQVVA